MTRTSCPFCADFTRSPAVAWEPTESRLLAKVGEISLCAGLGAIVAPYVLAYPRDHLLAVAELTESARRDLIKALDLCVATMLFPSGFLTVFEHGGGCTTDERTACLEHCHLHVVDGRFDLKAVLRSEFADAERVSLGTSEHLGSESIYLFAGTYKRDGVVEGLVVREPKCGSQFFRRALAGLVNEDRWNWRMWPRPEEAFALCEVWPPGAGNSSRPPDHT